MKSNSDFFKSIIPYYSLLARRECPDLSAMSSSFDPEGSQTLNGRPNGRNREGREVKIIIKLVFIIP